MNLEKIINNKKLLITIGILILIITAVFVIIKSNSTNRDIFDEEGNRYTKNGDIYYAEEATEEPDLEPENYL